MELKIVGDEWYAKKSRKAKTWERVTDILHFHGDFISCMGKAGRTNFHAYLGKNGNGYSQMYGVTSILDYWGQKDRLVQWAVDRVVEAIEAGEPLQRAKMAHKTHLNSAAASGTDVHAEVESYINFQLYPERGEVALSPQAQLFKEWAEKNEVVFLASEMPVFSKNWWCAGTMDFMCEIHGKRYVGDVKTSNYISPKHFFQCGAYAGMIDEDIDGLVIVHLPRSGGINIHFRQDVDKYTKAFENILYTVKMDKNESYQLGYS
jgi:hypothetical protein